MSVYRNSFFIKLICIITVISLLGNGIAWARGYHEPFLPPVIPENIGRINESWDVSRRSPQIIHIQDSHANYEAQMNIAKILEKILFNNRDKRVLIAVEGASGPIDLSLFHSFGHKEIKRVISDYLVKRGLMTGPEFYSANTSENNILIWGVENKNVYIKNLLLFNKLQNKINKAKEEVKKISRDILKLEKNTLSLLQKEFLIRYKAYHRDELGLEVYAKYLNRNIQGKNLNKLVQLIELKQQIDFSKVERERMDLIRELSRRFSNEEPVELVTKGIRYQAGDMPACEYFGYLAERADARLSNLIKYAAYVRLESEIDRDGLFKELRKAEEKTAAKIFTTKQTRGLYLMNKYLAIIEKFAEMKIYREDLKYYKACKDRFPEFHNPILNSFSVVFEQFCDTAIERDEIIVKNTISKMSELNAGKTILITGGFHTEGVKGMLQDRDIPYTIISPKIAKPCGKDMYKSILLADASAIHEAFKHSGTRLALMSKYNHIAPDTFYKWLANRGAEIIMQRLSRELNRQNKLEIPFGGLSYNSAESGESISFMLGGKLIRRIDIGNLSLQRDPSPRRNVGAQDDTAYHISSETLVSGMKTALVWSAIFFIGGITACILNGIDWIALILLKAGVFSALTVPFLYLVKEAAKEPIGVYTDNWKNWINWHEIRGLIKRIQISPILENIPKRLIFLRYLLTVPYAIIFLPLFFLYLPVYHLLGKRPERDTAFYFAITQFILAIPFLLTYIPAAFIHELCHKITGKSEGMAYSMFIIAGYMIYEGITCLMGARGFVLPLYMAFFTAIGILDIRPEVKKESIEDNDSTKLASPDMELYRILNKLEDTAARNTFRGIAEKFAFLDKRTKKRFSFHLYHRRYENIRVAFMVGRGPTGRVRLIITQAGILNLPPTVGDDYLIYFCDYQEKAVCRAVDEDIRYEILQDGRIVDIFSLREKGLISCAGEAFSIYRKICEPAVHHHPVKGAAEDIITIEKEFPQALLIKDDGLQRLLYEIVFYYIAALNIKGCNYPEIIETDDLKTLESFLEEKDIYTLINATIIQRQSIPGRNFAEYLRGHAIHEWLMDLALEYNSPLNTELLQSGPLSNFKSYLESNNNSWRWAEQLLQKMEKGNIVDKRIIGELYTVLGKYCIHYNKHNKQFEAADALFKKAREYLKDNKDSRHVLHTIENYYAILPLAKEINRIMPGLESIPPSIDALFRHRYIPVVYKYSDSINIKLEREKAHNIMAFSMFNPADMTYVSARIKLYRSVSRINFNNETITIKINQAGKTETAVINLRDTYFVILSEMFDQQTEALKENITKTKPGEILNLCNNLVSNKMFHLAKALLQYALKNKILSSETRDKFIELIYEIKEKETAFFNKGYTLDMRPIYHIGPESIRTGIKITTLFTALTFIGCAVSIIAKAVWLTPILINAGIYSILTILLLLLLREHLTEPIADNKQGWKSWIKWNQVMKLLKNVQIAKVLDNVSNNPLRIILAVIYTFIFFPFAILRLIIGEKDNKLYNILEQIILAIPFLAIYIPAGFAHELSHKTAGKSEVLAYTIFWISGFLIYEGLFYIISLTLPVYMLFFISVAVINKKTKKLISKRVAILREEMHQGTVEDYEIEQVDDLESFVTRDFIKNCSSIKQHGYKLCLYWKRYIGGPLYFVVGRDKNGRAGYLITKKQTLKLPGYGETDYQIKFCSYMKAEIKHPKGTQYDIFMDGGIIDKDKIKPLSYISKHREIYADMLKNKIYASPIDTAFSDIIEFAITEEWEKEILNVLEDKSKSVYAGIHPELKPLFENRKYIEAANIGQRLLGESIPNAEKQIIAKNVLLAYLCKSAENGHSYKWAKNFIKNLEISKDRYLTNLQIAEMYIILAKYCIHCMGDINEARGILSKKGVYNEFYSNIITLVEQFTSKIEGMKPFPLPVEHIFSHEPLPVSFRYLDKLDIKIDRAGGKNILVISRNNKEEKDTVTTRIKIKNSIKSIYFNKTAEKGIITIKIMKKSKIETLVIDTEYPYLYASSPFERITNGMIHLFPRHSLKDISRIRKYLLDNKMFHLAAGYLKKAIKYKRFQKRAFGLQELLNKIKEKEKEFLGKGADINKLHSSVLAGIWVTFVMLGYKAGCVACAAAVVYYLIKGTSASIDTNKNILKRFIKGASYHINPIYLANIPADGSLKMKRTILRQWAEKDPAGTLRMLFCSNGIKNEKEADSFFNHLVESYNKTQGLGRNEIYLSRTFLQSIKPHRTNLFLTSSPQQSTRVPGKVRDLLKLIFDSESSVLKTNTVFDIALLEEGRGGAVKYLNDKINEFNAEKPDFALLAIGKNREQAEKFIEVNGVKRLPEAMLVITHDMLEREPAKNFSQKITDILEKTPRYSNYETAVLTTAKHARVFFNEMVSNVRLIIADSIIKRIDGLTLTADLTKEILQVLTSIHGDFTEYDMVLIMNNILPKGLDKQTRQSIYNMILDKNNYIVPNRNKIGVDETEIIKRIKEIEENL